jgi:hypothetical protein
MVILSGICCERTGKRLGYAFGSLSMTFLSTVVAPIPFGQPA